MSWNYRIVKRIVDNPLVGGTDTIYAIHEAFYDKNGKIWGITTDACWIQGIDEQELKADFELYSKAFNFPVIEYDSIPEKGSINPLDEELENG